MKKMTTKQLKDMWIDFYTSKNHVQIAPASLVPENDNSVLFTTAGMHPLVPYLLGKPHPKGKRLCDYQKCVRTNDIESVGDASHLTFFEMLGSWSLGDYFKEQAIEYSFEFLTSPKYLGLPLDRLAFTVFAGDESAPRDEVAYQKWVSLGVDPSHVFFLPKEHNWWAAGETGPCGPDTEMFYITDKEPCGPNCSPACDCGRYLEIWNDVFMGYTKHTADGKVEELEKKNIDTGMGLERTVCVLNGYDSVYDVDSFQIAIQKLEELSGKSYHDSEDVTKAMRVIADHMRSSTMMIGDEVPTTPSNIGRGYVLRRLIRRSINYARSLNIDAMKLLDVVEIYIDFFKDYYPSLVDNHDLIISELQKEIKKFSNTITQGYKEFQKAIKNLDGKVLSGEVAFRLYETFGFPIELTIEMAEKEGLSVDMVTFKQCEKEHKEKSRDQSGKVFKGGLSGVGEMETKYHTATHLLLAGLRTILSDTIYQRGSNNTSERLRFDFNFDRKVTREELDQIENYVNKIIEEDVPVVCQVMPKEEARKSGAIGIFNDKYGDEVKVYTIGKYSKEFCGGPHVEHTGVLGHFKIVKEESSSAGVRRIKAILEPSK